MDFGSKLKQLRLGQRMTQQQLAERLGVAKSVVSYYESGDRFPSYDVLIKISRTFHTTTDSLLGIERQRTVDVSGLTEEQIQVVQAVAHALQQANRPLPDSAL
ncbi:MAG: helix-turn-helix transcriptional regulator [Clostridiales bacterium]|nr:helix-turn-helix transcriptional regulator [Clostridiales bacterium]